MKKISQKVLFFVLSALLLLTALLLSPVLIFGPRLACKTQIGRNLLLPRIKISPTGYGLQAPNLLRKILTVFTIPLDGVCKAIYTAFTGKQVYWLYEPVQIEVDLMSPMVWKGRDATQDEITAYLEQRKMLMAQLITAAGYRSMCWTRVVEIAQYPVPGKTDYTYQVSMF